MELVVGGFIANACVGLYAVEDSDRLAHRSASPSLVIEITFSKAGTLRKRCKSVVRRAASREDCILKLVDDF